MIYILIFVLVFDKKKKKIVFEFCGDLCLLTIGFEGEDSVGYSNLMGKEILGFGFFYKMI